MLRSQGIREFALALAVALLAALAFYFSTNATLHDLDYTSEIASAFLRGDLGLRREILFGLSAGCSA
jgi:hypothetical protein